MIGAGKRKDQATANAPGENLLASAYTKAMEAADSLKPSGSVGRSLMTGEYGWSGSMTRTDGHNGHCIAAFSGGKSESHVEVSTAGLDSIRMRE
jgi:hypothetical protein